MRHSCLFFRFWLAASLLSLFMLAVFVACRSNQSATNKVWVDPSPHKVGNVTVNGVRLNYLDWGGTGEALVLIPGSGDNPHAFDGIAPKLTDKFRVLSYARRGDGLSEDKGPYDVDTMVEDLRQLLDHFGIAKANLAGWSLGGHELTRFAGLYPERVGKLVYLDAAYDWSDMGTVWSKMPPYHWFDNPPSPADLQSFDNYRKWFTERSLRAGAPWSAAEAYARDYLAVDTNGRLQFLHPDSNAGAKRTADRASYHRDYRAVKAPALAIYVPYFLAIDVGSAAEQEAARKWTNNWWQPWQRLQRAKFESEMRNAQVRVLEGTNHMKFPFTHEREVVSLMRYFLLDEHNSAGK